MDLSIIIVNWNTRALLANCLASIVTPDDSSTRYEIIVVDNASGDGSAKMVQTRFPDVKLLRNDENVGFARANNQGIAAAHGRHVLLLNSDTEVEGRALTTMVSFLDANPRVGAVGARLLNSDGSLQLSCHPMITPLREFWRLTFLDRLLPRASYPASAWHRDRMVQVEVIKGACLMVRRIALDQVGLLDESYFMYTEEVDLCQRLADGGWQLWWLPAARVVHHGAASTRLAARDMYIQLYRSKVQFYRKFGGDRRARLFKLLVTLAYLPRLLIASAGALFSPRIAHQATTYRDLIVALPAM